MTSSRKIDSGSEAALLPKVLHVTTVHRADDTRIYRKEILSLFSLGYEVSLAAATDDNTKLSDSVSLLPLGRAGGTRWRRVGRNIRAFMAIMRNSGISHVHDPELLLTAAIPAFLGRRIVYDVHEWYRERFVSVYWVPAALRPLARWIYDAVERLVLPKFSGIVVTHPGMVQLYRSFLPEERVRLVRNYPRLSADEKERVRASRPPVQEPYIVHTGGASRLRAFDVIVRAAEVLRDSGVRARIANLGAVELYQFPKAERQELLERAERARVILVGLVPYEESLRWTAHARAAYLPLSDTENNRRQTPNKLLEYFLFGLPVVASDLGMTAELVKRHRAGVCVGTTNAEEHAAALRQLIESDPDHDAFAAASERAGAEYSFDREALKLDALYRSIQAYSQRAEPR